MSGHITHIGSELDDTSRSNSSSERKRDSGSPGSPNYPRGSEISSDHDSVSKILDENDEDYSCSKSLASLPLPLSLPQPSKASLAEDHGKTLTTQEVEKKWKKGYQVRTKPKLIIVVLCTVIVVLTISTVLVVFTYFFGRAKEETAFPSINFIYTIQAQGPSFRRFSNESFYLSYSTQSKRLDLSRLNDDFQQFEWKLASSNTQDRSLFLIYPASYNYNNNTFFPSVHYLLLNSSAELYVNNSTENRIQFVRLIPGATGRRDSFIISVDRTPLDRTFLAYSNESKRFYFSQRNAAIEFVFHMISDRSPIVQTPATSFECADPFIWQPKGQSNYFVECTGANIPFGQSTLHAAFGSHTSTFSFAGVFLGGNQPLWADGEVMQSLWAPESFQNPKDLSSYLFFAAPSYPDGRRHLAWAQSTSSIPSVTSYTQYSPTFLPICCTNSGEIDPHVFLNPEDNRTYLLWKSDDNSIGMKYTRLWIQEIEFSNDSVLLTGSSKQILDSTGLNWVNSWVPDGSLIEGPELIHRGDYYYLFFAAGKFCTDSYSEGVARSKTLFGPYEKLPKPILSTSTVGVAKSDDNYLPIRLVGPGHASFIRLSTELEDWRILWHASIGDNCNRYAFLSEMYFGEDDWPYVNNFS